MERILAIGINHKTAPIPIREKFFLSPVERDLLLTELKGNPAILEAFILSTCNRTEIYVRCLHPQMEGLSLLRGLFRIKKIEFSPRYHPFFYQFIGRDAVSHLLSVASGLDSLVLGEKEILGQVKMAFKRAGEIGLMHKAFNVLANMTVRTGKKARTETAISCGGSSVSWAAVKTVEKTLGTLRNKAVLVIGVGKMGDLALSQLSRKGLSKIYIMNRTQATANEYARRYHGESAAFCDIKEILSVVDCVICSVGAPHYILERSTLEKVMHLRKRKPLVLVDISVPRNIAPDCELIEGVQLFSVDTLDKIVDENLQKRNQAAVQVRNIIDQKIEELCVRYRRLDMDRLTNEAQTRFFSEAGGRNRQPV